MGRLGRHLRWSVGEAFIGRIGLGLIKFLHRIAHGWRPARHWRRRERCGRSERRRHVLHVGDGSRPERRPSFRLETGARDWRRETAVLMRYLREAAIRDVLREATAILGYPRWGEAAVLVRR